MRRHSVTGALRAPAAIAACHARARTAEETDPGNASRHSTMCSPTLVPSPVVALNGGGDRDGIWPGGGAGAGRFAHCGAGTGELPHLIAQCAGRPPRQTGSDRRGPRAVRARRSAYQEREGARPAAGARRCEHAGEWAKAQNLSQQQHDQQKKQARLRTPGTASGRSCGTPSRACPMTTPPAPSAGQSRRSLSPWYSTWMESIFAVVDVFWVSRLGPDAIATVGLTESMLTLVYTAAMGLSIGVGAGGRARIGEKQPDAAAEAAVQGIAIGLVVAAAVAVLGVTLAPKLLSLMGGFTWGHCDRVRLHPGDAGGSATVLLLFLINAIFRGAGDAAIAMRVLWLANIIRFLPGPCFIFGRVVPRARRPPARRRSGPRPSAAAPASSTSGTVEPGRCASRHPPCPSRAQACRHGDLCRAIGIGHLPGPGGHGEATSVGADCLRLSAARRWRVTPSLWQMAGSRLLPSWGLSMPRRWWASHGARQAGAGRARGVDRWGVDMVVLVRWDGVHHFRNGSLASSPTTPRSSPSARWHCAP